jgi:hypothetical protein
MRERERGTTMPDNQPKFMNSVVYKWLDKQESLGSATAAEQKRRYIEMHGGANPNGFSHSTKPSPAEQR